jgi:hypothetical protein
MASKTWKLGEVCKGGVITVEATAKKVTIIAKEWDFSQGFSKGSNQSNAKEWNRLEVSTSSSDAENKLMWFLFDLTTSYYTDQILEWVRTKTKFTSEW